MPHIPFPSMFLMTSACYNIDSYKNSFSGGIHHGKYQLTHYRNLFLCQISYLYRHGHLDADIAVLGVPYDQGAAWYGGQRLAPRAIRNISTAYARGETGFYDPEEDACLLASPIKVVDCGDADMLHGDREYCFSSIEESVRRIIKRGAAPAVMGGDHSISIPVAKALDEIGETINIVQFDAHLDFAMSRGPQKYGNRQPHPQNA